MFSEKMRKIINRVMWLVVIGGMIWLPIMGRRFAWAREEIAFRHDAGIVEALQGAVVMVAIGAYRAVHHIHHAIGNPSHPGDDEEYGNTEMFKAVRSGDTEKVAQLIREGADVNETNERGITLLHVAARKVNSKMVELLIGSGAKVNQADKGKYTPLHFAAMSDDRKATEVVRVLLGRGADPNKKDQFNDIPLHFAVKNGSQQMVEMLLGAGSDVNTSAAAGTPLHKAVWFRSDDLEMMRLLINKGAKVNSTVANNITPLHMAAHWGNSDCVKLLIQHGAKVDAKTSRRGYQPIHLAAAVGMARYSFTFEDFEAEEEGRYGNHEDVVRVLVEHGADVKNQATGGVAPLHMTSYSTAFLSLRRRATVSSHNAKLSRMMGELVSHGADINVKTNRGHTPWSLAVFFENVELAEMLVMHGAAPLSEMPATRPALLGDVTVQHFLPMHTMRVG